MTYLGSYCFSKPEILNGKKMKQRMPERLPDDVLHSLAFMPVTHIPIFIEGYHHTYRKEIDNLDGRPSLSSDQVSHEPKHINRVAQKLLTWSLLKELAKIDGVRIALVGRLNQIPKERDKYSGCFPCYMPKSSDSKQAMEIARYHVAFVEIPGFQVVVINLGSMGVELFQHGSSNPWTLYANDSVAIAPLSSMARITVFNPRQKTDCYEAEIPFHQLIEPSELAHAKPDLPLHKMMRLIADARAPISDYLKQRSRDMAARIEDSLESTSSSTLKYYNRQRLNDAVFDYYRSTPGTSSFFTDKPTVPSMALIESSYTNFGYLYCKYWLDDLYISKADSGYIAMRLFSYFILSTVYTQDRESIGIVIGKDTSVLRDSKNYLSQYEYALIKIPGKNGFVFCFRPGVPESSIRLAPLDGINSLFILSDGILLPPFIFPREPNDLALTVDDISGLLDKALEGATAQLDNSLSKCRMRLPHARLLEVREQIVAIRNDLFENFQHHLNLLQNPQDTSDPGPSCSTSGTLPNSI
jgi:hypothetical protein